MKKTLVAISAALAALAGTALAECSGSSAPFTVDTRDVQPKLTIVSADIHAGSLKLDWSRTEDGTPVNVPCELWRGVTPDLMAATTTNLTSGGAAATSFVDEGFSKVEPLTSPLYYWVVPVNTDRASVTSEPLVARKRIGLSVGYSEFPPEKKLGKSIQAYNEAKLFQELCIKKGGFDQKNTQFLSNGGAKTKDIRDEMKRLAGLANPGDTFAFYIATHGAIYETGESARRLTTFDDYYTLAHLQEDIRSFPSDTKVVCVIMACHAESMIGNPQSPTKNGREEWKENSDRWLAQCGFAQCLGNVAWIASCRAEQNSKNSVDYSLFGQAFLADGWESGYADSELVNVENGVGGNGDGVVTFLQLANYASVFARWKWITEKDGKEYEYEQNVQIENDGLLAGIVAGTCPTPTPVKPGKPTILSVETVGAADQKITWQPAAHATGYRVYRTPVGADKERKCIAHSWEKGTTFTDCDAKLMGQYIYEVQGYNKGGFGDCSAEFVMALPEPLKNLFCTFLETYVKTLVPGVSTMSAYEAARYAVAANGLTYEECFLAGLDPTKADNDGDGLPDGEEVELGTDPTKADTDGDGLPDGKEVELGTDPTNSDLNIVIVDAYPSLNCGWLYHPLSDGEVSFFIDAYDPDGEELIYAWYVDGREVAGAVGARFACDISGFETGSRHVVECNVTDGLCPRAMSWVIDVTRDLYVDASSPAASPDGRSPGTAFREIPDAVAAAGHGDVIHVAPGTYAPLPPGGGKALRIVSDEGAGTTIVDGRGEGPCVEDGHGYTLVGFTMCNGVSRDGAVIYDCALCNCVVRDCSTQGDCPISYCDLFDCLVVGNAGRASGAGDFYSRFFGCTITGNLATEAGGCGGIDPTCQAYNSIIAGNTCCGSESNYGTAYAEPVMLSCCTSPRLSGTFADEVYGNIYTDPRFVDPANGDFRLRPDSPCIDAGDDTVIAFLDDLDLFNSTTCATDGTDVAGHARVMGKGVDIGALEYFAAQAPIDYDGDGRCDIAVYDPRTANWCSEIFGVAQYGWGSTIPTPADYDGDGITDYAAYDQADGAWYILYSADNRYFIPHWGWTGALPVPADYDGDGCADICVFDTKTSTWYIHGTSEGDRVQQFGWSGVVPVPADYDGDGRIDLAIYSPHKKTGNVGAWYILRSSDGATEIYAWGWDGAIPTPADFDGDGKADLAVFNRLDGFWYIHRSSIGGNDCWVPQYGWKTATPVPADYDGDGIADLGIYDLTTGVWYTFGTAEGHRERTFGWRGAVPLNPIYWIHRWFGL